MAKRQQDDPSTRTEERRGEQPKRQPAAPDPSKERRGERDTGSERGAGGQRGTGRSWVHDEPPLEQGDDPQRSGYSDRETPEAPDPGARTGRQSERPTKR